ncbi:SdpI family protein [Leifsonia sp. ZF2019]|uniref:SdpI family protein n=1 Tax=Leifsonia sp. ZF2019 TaxID=2781978 RepID=UPI001CBC6F02|nr:SdpI family protein [Leifsonia sp. ZF2019]UAJ79158.1 SdpI family protein [Leifsonia sp. ZF2019]
MTALLTLIGLAIVLILVVGLCAGGTIGANRGIGIRLPATRLSESAWRAGHRAALLPAIVGGGVVIVIAGVGLAYPDLQPAMQVIGIVLFLGTLTWATLCANNAARALADDRRDR